LYKALKIETLEVGGITPTLQAMRLPMEGRKQKTEDEQLAKVLIKRGTDHAKFSRGAIVWVDMHFQIGWMVELDTYRIGREVLSTSSSMHNELREMSGEELASQKQKDLPNKYYHQICYFSYPTLRAIYIARRKHRHPDWQVFCDWVETLPSFDVLIMPEKQKIKESK